MAKALWEIWLDDEKTREKYFDNYVSLKKIKVEEEKEELVQGHMEKADHDLKFVKSVLALREFNDWVIVSAYYAIYHAALALCALKGYSTKDHGATLLILIREFYKKLLTKEEIETLGSSSIEKEEVLHYVEAKLKRSKASYSTKKVFDKNEAEILRLKAISFVNKVKNIIDNSANYRDS